MPDGIKFSELQSTLTLGNNDLAAVSHDNGDSTYTSVKVPMTQLGQKVVNDIDYTQALNTTSKKPIGAINELKNELMNIYPVLATSPAPIANFTTDLALPLKSLKVEIKPKQAASANPPSPSNPLSISGTDTVIVTQLGANFWDEQWEVGSISSTTGEDTANNNRIRSKNYIPIKPATTFYLRINFITTTVTMPVRFYDANKNFIGVRDYSGSYFAVNTAFKTPENAYYMRFVTPTDEYGTTYRNDISINYPSTDTQYHAHVTATTKTVSLPETVYGGEVDLIGGSGAKKFGVVDLGDLNWLRYSPEGTNIPVFYAGIADTAINKTNGLCEIFKVKAWEPLTSRTDMTLCPHPTIASIYVADSDYTTVADFKTAVSGYKYIYELATPTQITLANPIDLTALAGVNNVFGDTDGNTSVEYRESVQKYVDDNIAAVQALIL